MTGNIVHFVYFETLLCSRDFLSRWEGYNNPAHTNAPVTLQESKKGNVSTYIAKHSCDADEFKFAVTRGTKSTRSKQPEIKQEQFGGYSVVLQENKDKPGKDESILFMFLKEPLINTSDYKKVQPFSRLNIYQAYFENCAYTYILEYFINHTDIAAFKENLSGINAVNPIIYTEILLP